MSILEVIFIAVGLSIDCFAVATTSSMAIGRYEWPKMLRMAVVFSLFQGTMPLIGYFAGAHFSATFVRIDHWVAFIILGFIGGKMIWDSLRKNKKEKKVAKSPLDSWHTLLILAFATSIDELVTGLIYIPYHNLIYWAAPINGLVTFAFTILGCFVGVQFGKRFKWNVQLIGGIILIIIGINVLFEHVV